MVYEGGGGLKKSKKLSTWFMNDPLEQLSFFPCECSGLCGHRPGHSQGKNESCSK